jgi:ubiquinol-cytochrome c reductase iron-sulfur subunit
MTILDDDQHSAHSKPGTKAVDLSDPRLSRFEIVREGARRDDIEIVTYESQFPGPNTKGERRIVRNMALLFLFAGLMGLVFLVAYIWWPWRFELGNTLSDYFTPILGISRVLALLAIGFAVLTWAKKLLPHEVSIQDRHEAMVTEEDQKIAGNTMLYMVDELGIKRRPLLTGALVLGLAPIGLVVAAPLVGGLIQNPHRPDRGQDPPLFRTGWDKAANGGKPVRMTREDGSPIRPEDVSVGGQITVFPGIPGGATNLYADSPTLLIHLRAEDAAIAARDAAPINQGSMWGNFIAYSKICTHAGCPASLYEQQTNRLLCPCHQSQFLITDNAKPIFGPATRRLPQLPITLDDEGFLVASSDYRETVGPDFWERP